MSDAVRKSREDVEKEQELDSQGSDGTEELVDWICQPEDVRIWQDEFHVLHAEARGRTFDNVRPRRVFPLSGRCDYVSLLNEKDREVVLLARPDDLDEESQAALRGALDLVYYVAKITRVDSIKETMGVTLWEVMTDRGYANFEVVDRRHIRNLAGGRLIIVDVDGNRFEVENLADLDERSQAYIYSET
jgi:hypothetical protein